MAMERLSLFLPDDQATTSLGQLLATILRPGDLVLLQGELGAGKTALARATIRALVGDPALDVPSPSFALVQPYEAGEQAIMHADLYRLADAREIDELGIIDDADAIVLVEWPERAPELNDKANVMIDLALGPNSEGRVAAVTITDSGRHLTRLAAEAGLPATSTN